MVRNILMTIEIILLFIFIIPIFSGIINPGNIVGILVFALLLGITIDFDRFKSVCVILFSSPIGKIGLSLVAVLVAEATVYCTVLSCFMVNAQLKSPENVKAVIVLGCKVNDDKPSRMLARRLDSAYSFLIKNEEAICIVSGGKGDDEKIPEAEAMKNYLVEKGINEKRVIMEDKSANTDENLKFSSEILKEYKIKKAAIVTDGFHQYRAGYIAKKYGIEAYAINAKNDRITLPLIPTYWVREWMAITKEYVF